MKSFLKLKSIVFLLLSIMLIGTACQSVSGVDLNKVMTQNMDVQSYEGQTILSVDFGVNESVADDEFYAEDLRMLELFQGATLQIVNAKYVSDTHFSYQGILTLHKGELHFSAYSDGSSLFLEIDGAKQPIIFENVFQTPDIEAFITLMQGYALNEDESEAKPLVTEEQIVDLQKQVGAFLITHFPNPQDTSVDHFVRTEINGETELLTKVELTLGPEEAATLLKQMLRNIINDEESLEELLSQIYDVFAPVIIQSIKAEQKMQQEWYEEYGYEPDSDPLDAFLYIIETKEDAVAFATSMLNMALIYLNAEVETNADSALPFEEGSYLNTAFYFNSNKYIQKNETELFIDFADDEYSIVDTVSFNLINETWNMNSTVIEVQPIENYEQAVSVMDLGMGSTLEDAVETD